MTERKPILVVDDDRDLATMMKRFLEHHGWRVVVVTIRARPSRA